VTEFPSLEELLRIAAKIQRTSKPAVRDYGLLESALARPQASIFGQDAYPSLVEKVAALMHSLARNHALVDGNKRLAWVTTRAVFILNGYDLRAPSVDEGEEFVLEVARGELEVPEMAKTLQAWTTSVSDK
jgi:death-on-curing protein